MNKEIENRMEELRKELVRVQAVGDVADMFSNSVMHYYMHYDADKNEYKEPDVDDEYDVARYAVCKDIIAYLTKKIK